MRHAAGQDDSCERRRLIGERAKHGDSGPSAVKEGGETSSLQVGICAQLFGSSEPLRVLCDALNCPDTCQPTPPPLLSSPTPSSHSLLHLLQRPLYTCVRAIIHQGQSPPFKLLPCCWTLALPKQLPAIQGSALAPCSRAASDFCDGRGARGLIFRPHTTAHQQRRGQQNSQRRRSEKGRSTKNPPSELNLLPLLKR